MKRMIQEKALRILIKFFYQSIKTNSYKIFPILELAFFSYRDVLFASLCYMREFQLRIITTNVVAYAVNLQSSPALTPCVILVHFQHACVQRANTDKLSSTASEIVFISIGDLSNLTQLFCDFFTKYLIPCSIDTVFVPR